MAKNRKMKTLSVSELSHELNLAREHRNIAQNALAAIAKELVFQLLKVHKTKKYVRYLLDL